MPHVLLQSDPVGWSVLPNHTSLGITVAGQLAIKSPAGVVQIIASGAPGFQDYINTAGETDIIPGAAIVIAQVDVQGAARTVPVVKRNGGSGALMNVLFKFPATAGLVINLYDDAVGGGNLLDTFTTDGTIRNGTWFLYYAAGKWNMQMSKIPAF